MKNIIGQKFARLTAVSPNRVDKNNGQTWDCLCDCGNTVCVPASHLKNGHTKSCGCLKNEKAAELIGKRSLTHGATVGRKKERLYRIWCQMRRRCSKPKDSSYQWYGAKGISVCSEWNTYSTFSAWAIHNGYEASLTLDRVDPKGDYSPDNCQWITNAENVSRARKAKTGEDVTDKYRRPE